MDLPTVVGQQTLYYIEVSLSFTYFLSLPLLKSYRKLLEQFGSNFDRLRIHQHGTDDGLLRLYAVGHHPLI